MAVAPLQENREWKDKGQTKEGRSYLAILALVARHLLSDSYGPFDRIVEFLVCALILYEVVIGIIQRRKSRRRKDCIDKRIAAMRDLMSQGQQLQTSVPSLGDARVATWTKQVEQWTEQVRALLKSYSAHAETAFLHQEPIYAKDYVATPLQFAWLVNRLGNLRSIIEKPDVYF